jgi:hypothetical protein
LCMSGLKGGEIAGAEESEKWKGHYEDELLATAGSWGGR